MLAIDEKCVHNANTTSSETKRMDAAKIRCYETNSEYMRLFSDEFYSLGRMKDYVFNPQCPLVGMFVDIRRNVQRMDAIGRITESAFVPWKRVEITNIMTVGQTVFERDKLDKSSVWVEVEVSFDGTFDPACLRGLSSARVRHADLFGRSYGYMHNGKPTVRIFAKHNKAYYEKAFVETQESVPDSFALRGMTGFFTAEDISLIGKSVRVGKRVGKVAKVVESNSLFFDVILKALRW